MRTVYRISKCKYIRDLSGLGAYLYSGRWHTQGVYMLYTAASRSLALLECVAHLVKMPAEGFCIASIEIPEHSILKIKINDLPEDWQKFPAPSQLALFGNRFIKENKYLALEVPSAIMEEESNILLNPLHKDFAKVSIKNVRTLNIDERLLRK